MYRSFLKRFFDIFFALCLLPFMFPVCLILCILIAAEDKGSPFYNAKRLGKDGRVFSMFKLRTMKQNAPDIRNSDGSTYSGEDDPRLTVCGRWIRKYSLDELPQILNILKGDMSFIGPRPDLPSQKQFYEGNESEKLAVKPGLTGYAQAYGRNANAWKDRIQLDIFYVRNLSFLLDVKILVRTVFTVLRAENVFTPKQ